MRAEGCTVIRRDPLHSEMQVKSKEELPSSLWEVYVSKYVGLSAEVLRPRATQLAGSCTVVGGS